MALTLPVTLVACVTAAVTYRPGLPSVIDVALTAATLPPIASRSAWPEPGVGIEPLPGWSWFPVPPGALSLGVAPGAAGEAFAAAGLSVASGSTAVTTANPAAAATSAVAAIAAARRLRWCAAWRGGG